MLTTKDKIKQAVAGAIKATGQGLQGRTGIFSTLSKDHGKVASLMSELAETDNDEVHRREALFETIRVELLAHAQAEDAVFYERCSSLHQLVDKVALARDEHGDIETLLAELSHMHAGQQAWMDKFVSLKTRVSVHVAVEEKEVFPIAQEYLSGDEADALDAEYAQRRESAMKRLGDAA